MAEVLKCNLKRVLDRHPDWNQLRLAQALERQPRTVRDWCSGATSPEVRDLLAVANILGCSVHDLYVLQGFRPPKTKLRGQGRPPRKAPISA